jgi:hypothetical protein
MIEHKQTKAQEKAWYNRIAEYVERHGTFPHHNLVEFQMHHIFGRKFSHNKVSCGAWAVLPIEKKYHDVHSNNQFNVTHFRKRYQIEFGNQRDQFYAMCMVIKDEDGELPFPDEVLHAILETSY